MKIYEAEQGSFENFVSRVIMELGRDPKFSEMFSPDEAKEYAEKAKEGLSEYFEEGGDVNSAAGAAAKWLKDAIYNGDLDESTKASKMTLKEAVEILNRNGIAVEKINEANNTDFIPGKIKDKVLHMAAKEIGMPYDEVKYFADENESLGKSFEIMRGYGRYDEWDYAHEIELAWNKTMYGDID